MLGFNQQMFHKGIHEQKDISSYLTRLYLIHCPNSSDRYCLKKKHCVRNLPLLLWVVSFFKKKISPGAAQLCWFSVQRVASKLKL